MATLPNFQRISQCHQTLATEISLIENLSTINNEQIAKQRHEELLNVLKAMDARINQLAEDTKKGQDALKTGQDALKKLVFAKQVSLFLQYWFISNIIQWS